MSIYKKLIKSLNNSLPLIRIAKSHFQGQKLQKLMKINKVESLRKSIFF